MWVKKFNLQITFMYNHFSHYANPPKCSVDTADIRKTLDAFYIYLFGQWFVEIKLKELYPHLCVCEQFCCKILAFRDSFLGLRKLAWHLAKIECFVMAFIAGTSVFIFFTGWCDSYQGKLSAVCHCEYWNWDQSH